MLACCVGSHRPGVGDADSSIFIFDVEFWPASAPYVRYTTKLRKSEISEKLI